MSICPKCGLPQEICVCETIAKEEQQILVKLVKRKFGKIITIVEGINDKSIDIKDIAKKLKSKLACGGTTKGNSIELQGNHAEKVKEFLIELGFPASTINVKEVIE